MKNSLKMGPSIKEKTTVLTNPPLSSIAHVSTRTKICNNKQRKVPTTQTITTNISKTMGRKVVVTTLIKMKIITTSYVNFVRNMIIQLTNATWQRKCHNMALCLPAMSSLTPILPQIRSWTQKDPTM